MGKSLWRKIFERKETEITRHEETNKYEVSGAVVIGPDVGISAEYIILYPEKVCGDYIIPLSEIAALIRGKQKVGRAVSRVKTDKEVEGVV